MVTSNSHDAGFRGLPIFARLFVHLCNSVFASDSLTNKNYRDLKVDTHNVVELHSRQKPSKSSFCERILRVVPNESPMGVDSENIELHPI